MVAFEHFENIISSNMFKDLFTIRKAVSLGVAGGVRRAAGDGRRAAGGVLDKCQVIAEARMTRVATADTASIDTINMYRSAIDSSCARQRAGGRKASARAPL
ncbi:hypothetical protein EVAR_45479_1 [Eumeta japonica]|uniref:Uncharacterized protein n=1 Tax=Eumeta variegata TaxID=151549 RepID=A0A4C1WEK6_EUMVA|nr:hypothetical protein EVAR_45479_1 [Eumeta japonica]